MKIDRGLVGGDGGGVRVGVGFVAEMAHVDVEKYGRQI